ncbi:MAG TPA: SDR family NAD(P)-dependent oxidoreductase, partial [Acidimicrobiales bacterium]|nr:SDR family NAD(P)-dependent oxidoreductase [Acidimicrobiales bacterium]
MAAEGCELVLVARTVDAMERLAAELQASHGTACEVIAADLADRPQLEQVAQRVRAGDIDTVVNNAGFGFYGPVTSHDSAQEVGMVDVDVAAVVALSHAALQTMVARNGGNLLNVASVAAFAATPDSATYSAAKGFVLMFTEAVHDEVAPSGVHVTVLCPGFTRTNFQAAAGLEAK